MSHRLGFKWSDKVREKISLYDSCHSKTNFNKEYWLIYLKEDKYVIFKRF